MFWGEGWIALDNPGLTGLDEVKQLPPQRLEGDRWEEGGGRGELTGEGR